MELRDAVLARRMVRTYDPQRPVPAAVLSRLLELAVRSPSAGFSQGWDFLVLRRPADTARFWALTSGSRPPDRWLAGMRTAPVLVLCLSDPQRYLARYAEPDKAEPDKAEPDKAEPDRAEPDKAEPDRAEPGKAEPGKAEPGKAEPGSRERDNGEADQGGADQGEPGRRAPDQGLADRDPQRWPVPYWDVDTGMAALLVLLGAVDEGLGGCFFGVPPDRHAAVLAGFGVPDGRRIVGVVSLGYRPPDGADRRSPSLRRGRRPLAEVAHDGSFGTPWT